MKTRTFQVPVVIEVVATNPDQAALKVNKSLNFVAKLSDFTGGTEPYVSDFLVDANFVQRADRALHEWFDEDELFARQTSDGFKLLSWILCTCSGAIIASVFFAYVRG
jgi:hypothetical protein